MTSTTRRLLATIAAALLLLQACSSTGSPFRLFVCPASSDAERREPRRRCNAQACHAGCSWPRRYQTTRSPGRDARASWASVIPSGTPLHATAVPSRRRRAPGRAACVALSSSKAFSRALHVASPAADGRQGGDPAARTDEVPAGDHILRWASRCSTMTGATRRAQRLGRPPQARSSPTAVRPSSSSRRRAAHAFGDWPAGRTVLALEYDPAGGVAREHWKLFRLPACPPCQTQAGL